MDESIIIPTKSKLSLRNGKIAPITKILQYILSVCVIFLFWQIVTMIGFISRGLLPPPMEVLSNLLLEYRDFYHDYVIATFRKAFLGGIIGISLGLMIGLSLGYSRRLRFIFEPMLTIFQSFPREALYPILVVIIGVGDFPQITNAVLLSLFPVAVTVLNGILDTRKDYVELVKSWGANKFQEFIYCRLPYLVPSLVGSLKLSLPFALVGAVLAEMLGGGTNPGLGNLINTAQSGQGPITMYVAIILLASIGMSLIGLLNVIEQLVLRRFKHG